MKPSSTATLRFDSILSRVSLRSLLLCGLILASATIVQAQVFNYTTLAGYAGQQNADGTNAFITQPVGAAVDGSGNIYVSDFNNNTIRKISSNGTVTTFAGSPGVAGSANGSGTGALFNGPEGVAVDVGGNVYVADAGNDMIRKITPAGLVTTLAGSAGNPGSANGTGTNAFFYAPQGIAVDISSNVYVADYGNHAIRKITPAGVVSTLAGSVGTAGSINGTGTSALFYEPEGVAVDALGNVYVADTANDMIRVINVAGMVSTLAGSTGNYGSVNANGTNALFNSPEGVAVDSTGNVYVADTGNNLVRKITVLGAVSTLAGSGNAGSQDGMGTNAQFWGPVGISTDSAGNLYVADYFNGTVRKITSAGAVSTLAGSASNGSADGPDANARFSVAQGVAVDTSSNIYVADAANNTIRKISPNGTVSTFAGLAGSAGSANGAGTNAQFYAPQAVAVDSLGNVYVADTLNHTIREINSAGNVITLAGVAGYSNNADGTGANAQFYAPQGIAVDGSGNVYVADTLNYTIRAITPSGAVSTLAGTAGTYGSADGTNGNALFNWPKGLAVDSATNIYVADSLNHTIRKVTSAGAVTTLAGSAGVWGSADGTNSNARFFEPDGIAVDSSTNIYVSDSGNHTIRKITPVGTNWVVTTVGGQAANSGSIDGLQSSAFFFYPSGLARDTAGNIYVADSGNNTIRLGTLQPVTTLYNLSVQPRPTTAIITWTTGAPASSQVVYGLTTNYGSSSTVNSTLATNHGVLLTGLSASNIYYFKAISQFGPVQGTATGSFSTDPTIIMLSSNASYLGVWVLDSSAQDRYSPSYYYASVAPAAPTASATFQPTIITPAQYDVSLWYSEGGNRSMIAPVTVSFQNGSFSTNMNESVNGGRWQLVTRNQTFAAGASGFVRLGNYTGESNKIVISDAVKWSYTAGQDIPVNGNVPAWWANFYFGTNNIDSSQSAANGYSILDDYLLGIAPNDPNAHLNFTMRPVAGGVQAIFSPYLGGHSYQLQSTTNFSNPNWQTLANLPVTQDTNGNGVITASVTNSTSSFYRLSVQLLP
ncbi:MAG TPA: hypothetical protein VG754_08480 [Verrucomicrobiae bacterium]|nr:hypothetical protein [Verrucomicrobiae bacterium]